LTVGGEDGIGIAILAGEWENGGSGPLAVDEMGFVEDVEVVGRGTFFEVEGLAVGGDGAAKFIVGGGDDAFADYFGDGSVRVLRSGGTGGATEQREDEAENYGGA
jgi:hypothetical protein